jgi:hypothetical protein
MARHLALLKLRLKGLIFLHFFGYRTASPFAINTTNKPTTAAPSNVAIKPKRRLVRRFMERIDENEVAQLPCTFEAATN